MWRQVVTTGEKAFCKQGAFHEHKIMSEHYSEGSNGYVQPCFVGDYLGKHCWSNNSWPTHGALEISVLCFLSDLSTLHLRAHTPSCSKTQPFSGAATSPLLLPDPQDSISRWFLAYHCLSCEFLISWCHTSVNTPTRNHTKSCELCFSSRLGITSMIVSPDLQLRKQTATPSGACGRAADAAPCCVVDSSRVQLLGIWDMFFWLVMFPTYDRLVSL